MCICKQMKLMTFNSMILLFNQSPLREILLYIPFTDLLLVVLHPWKFYFWNESIIFFSEQPSDDWHNTNQVTFQIVTQHIDYNLYGRNSTPDTIFSTALPSTASMAQPAGFQHSNAVPHTSAVLMCQWLCVQRQRQQFRGEECDVFLLGRMASSPWTMYMWVLPCGWVGLTLNLLGDFYQHRRL